MSEARGNGWARLSSIRIGAAIAIAVAAAVVVWLLVRGDDGDSSSAPTTQTTTVPEIGPVASTPARLRALAKDSEHPVYWIGPRRRGTYELKRTSNGQIFIRYLPPGAKVGNPRAKYTIIGTSPVPDAHDVLEKLAEKPGEKSTSAPDDGLVVYSKDAPTNVYLAYPDSDVQIEVFDPSPKRALRLATSGRVTPVG